MKRLLLFAAALAGGFLATGLATGSAAAAPITLTGSDTTASASFATDIGGVQTSTSVYASDHSFSDLSGTFEGSDVFVDIFQFDPGNPRNPRDDQFHYFSGYAELTQDQFQILGTLDSATLSAVVNVCEFEGKEGGPGAAPPPQPNCFDVTVDLSWTGTGVVQTFSGKSNSRFDGCRVHSTFSNSFRSAVAEGSISDGVTNFTPNPSDFADLSTFSSKDTYSGDCFFPPPPEPAT
jgi:hypothetical protein